MDLAAGTQLGSQVQSSSKVFNIQHRSQQREDCEVGEGSMLKVEEVTHSQSLRAGCAVSAQVPLRAVAAKSSTWHRRFSIDENLATSGMRCGAPRV